MRFRIFAHADVPDRRRHQDAFGAFERAQHDLNRKLTSIPSPSVQFNSRSDLLRQCLGCGSGTVRDQPFRETLRNDVLYLLPYQFIAAVSELLFRLNIQ